MSQESRQTTKRTPSKSIASKTVAHKKTNTLSSRRKKPESGPSSESSGNRPKPNDSSVQVYLLDVGPEEYGDAVLCRFDEETVLIDGAHPGNYRDKGADHPSIGSQIGQILKQKQKPYKISLLIVTHAHGDHIGCLPRLVGDHTIQPEWALVADPGLGWGRPGSVPDRDSDQSPALRQLAALLREEVVTHSDDETLASFAEDAVNLEQTYTSMLEALTEGGTKVVRYGRDDTGKLSQRFASIGLQIIGPTTEQLVHCAELINRRSQDLLELASAKLPDAARCDSSHVVAAYRDVVDALQSDSDAADAFSKDKGAVNDQSIVTLFKVNSKKLLFTGDMQLAQPEVSDQFIVDSIQHLNEVLAGGAPYDLLKLSHHGSYNGFNEELWQKWGQPQTIGICAGSGSTQHPNPQTLEVLKAHTSEIEWVRTDHNGLSSFAFDGGRPQIMITRGEQNDPVPNTSDLPAPATPEFETESSPQIPVQIVPAPSGGVVEIRIPAGIQVSLSIEVKSTGSEAARTAGSDIQLTEAERELGKLTGKPGPIAIGGAGRLPKLAFITDKPKLAANIGIAETNAVLARLRAAGHVVLEQVPKLIGRPMAELLQQNPAILRGIRGVVLLGGYDVVAPRRLDTLSASLRSSIPSGSDADDFIVWSDDAYGGNAGNGMPELPVSRIPDGRSSLLVFAALAADSCQAHDPRDGIRNMRRPFAEPIYNALPGTAAMLVSEPVTTSNSYSLDSQRIYIMLHGDYQDGTQFWGESSSGGYPAAVDLTHVPARPGAVAFTGCCWGALSANTRAVDYHPGQLVGPRSASSSIALRFLANGVRAFIGCTGTHYSPTVPPYNYYGGPMHSAFWSAFQAGTPPALALLRAKTAYRQGMPHGQPAGSVGEAIEYKILRQYTCLGLGW